MAGTITQDELKAALKQYGAYEEQDIKEILLKVDKDQDGSIDYEEFVDMMVCSRSCVRILAIQSVHSRFTSYRSAHRR